MATFTSTSGNNTFHGTSASDTVKFSGPASGYRIEYLSNGIVRVVDINTANGNQGSDLLTNIDQLAFSDKSYSIALTGAPLDFRVLPDSDNVSSVVTTGLSNGGYVLSWTVRASGGSDFDVYTRQYDKYGVMVGGDERVNTTTLYSQHANDIIPLSDGGYVIAWKSADSSGWDGDLRIQKFDGLGVKVGTETILDSGEQSYEYRIIGLDDGSYVVSWFGTEEIDMGGGLIVAEEGIYTQRFGSTGSSLGAAVFTSQLATNNTYPRFDLASQSNGGYVLTWQAYGSQNAYFQRFDADGTHAGGTTVVNSGKPSDDVTGPDITALDDGSYVIIWSSKTGGTIYEYTLFAQHYDADGQALSSTFQINTTQVSHASKLSIATLENGDYVVAWNSSYYPGSDGKGNADAIYAQRFDSAGSKIGAEIRVNSNIGLYTTDPVVTALADGGFIVNWSTADGEWDTADNFFAQRFDANGKAYALSTQAITGTSANDTINAGVGMQSINGLGGNDILRGGTDNDTLNGSTGNDSLYGGAGNDTYILADVDKVFENSNQGTDTVKTSITYTLGNNLENLILTGSKAINGSGNTLANRITGNSGNNTLDGKSGNDTLDGGLGKDTLIGGAGNDIYIIKDADIVKELDVSSFDTIKASIAYTLTSNIERLELTGNSAINGTGNSLDNGIQGNTAANILKGVGGNDDIRGASGNDKLYGGDGTDWLFGEAGNDTVYGDAGDDYLHCGPGSDTLHGGVGKDIFIFSDDITGVDTLADYSTANDVIELSRWEFPKLAAGTLKAANFAANISGMALDSNDYILYETSTGKLYYDADGNSAGAKVLFAIIGTATHPAMTAAEFTVT
jgi:Ca2+-binding RTX toxin-like protein